MTTYTKFYKINIIMNESKEKISHLGSVINTSEAIDSVNAYDKHIQSEVKRCSWCENPMKIYLIHQAFCEKCAQEYRELHMGFQVNNDSHF